VLARLDAIVLGLSEFYSVTDPSKADLDKDLESSRTVVEGALLWLRKAANSFARAKMSEQESVIRLTVKPKGNSLLQDLIDGIVLNFPDKLVANMTRPLLRGVSATAEPLTGDAWVNLELVSPDQKLNSENITLPSVTVRLGRVSSSTSLNVRDILG